MPLYKTDKGLLYFAHVPLAGGSLFDRYLAERFGTAALHDPRYSGQPTTAGASPVQHIEQQHFSKMFPQHFLDDALALVRHPTSRVVAAYQLRQRAAGESDFPEFSSWLAEHAELIASDSNKLPGDLRWQSSFLPRECRVFKLEAGLDHLADYLDEQFGQASRELLVMPVAPMADNKTQAAVEQDASNVSKAAEKPASPVLSATDHQLIGEIYQKDFTLLKYPTSAPRVVH
ncbi:MAG: sulfotransferase family 2 domain-containing protein [Porticoccaceae bacterium]